jgi:hypothetical protein
MHRARTALVAFTTAVVVGLGVLAAAPADAVVGRPHRVHLVDPAGHRNGCQASIPPFLVERDYPGGPLLVTTIAWLTCPTRANIHWANWVASVDEVMPDGTLRPIVPSFLTGSVGTLHPLRRVGDQPGVTCGLSGLTAGSHAILYRSTVRAWTKHDVTPEFIGRVNRLQTITC